MDSSCGERKILSNAFQEIRWGRWMGGEDSATCRWNRVHVDLVERYILNLHLNSDLRLLSSATLLNTELRESGRLTEYRETLASFTQELQEFFRMPRPEQLFVRDDTLKKNELLAAFINFLLQLLHCKVDFDYPFNGRIESLEKELRFLLTVLGDTPFLSDELEHVQNILADFEAVANEAGSLVHSYIFSLDPAVLENIDDRLGVTLSHVDQLKAKISDLLPLIAEAYTTPNRAAVDSLFIVDSLLRDLEDLLNRDDNQNIPDQIKTLHTELMSCQSLLKDFKVAASLSGMEENKETFSQITDAAYEAEYLINNYLQGGCPLSYFSIRLTLAINKIKVIGSRFQEMKRISGVRPLKKARKLTGQRSLHTKRDPEIDDPIVGLEDTTNKILDQLEGGRKNRQIISIVGMPGLGKTTLAKKLYNHPLVIRKFDKRIWCVVSQTYEIKGLLGNILISSTSDFSKDEISKMEEETLAEYIHKSLMGRRYLIIVDDIWSSIAWDGLRRCFPDDGNKSRILFTSRNNDAVPHDSIFNSLPLLPHDKSWELLKKKVFHDKTCPPKLVGIGEKIAAGCHGLPLAVVVIAGILSTMDNEESAWEKVAENLASYIFDADADGNFMMRTLELSYNHLSDHLKPCFLYLGSFPEDRGIPVSKLLKLWIAEGFICREEKKTVENVAEKYLMELIDKSLVIVTERRSNGRGARACVLHDLLRDLCLKIAEEKNFLVLINRNCSMYKRHHQIVSYNDTPPFGLHVRSFLNFETMVDLMDVLNMRSLRVFDSFCGWSGGCDDDYFDVIGRLIHLRYLVVNKLPASISNLVNLEYISVLSSEPEPVIPPVIGKMMKLRYLKFHGYATFGEDFDSFEIISNVEYLSAVEINEQKDVEILKSWPHLRKLKCRCQPLRVEDKGAVEIQHPDFSVLTRLESLYINYVDIGDYFWPRVGFNFPLTLKKLTLLFFQFPWEQMSLIGGLPKLEVLKMLHGSGGRGTWETRDGEFKQLRYLLLAKAGLAKWNVGSKEHFPKLERLFLHGCKRLEEIPSEIGKIENLQLVEVYECSEGAAESARNILEEQQEMGNDQLRIAIRSDPRREGATWFSLDDLVVLV